MNERSKPAIDPVTGCAHIMNLNTYCRFRVCSYCHAEVKQDEPEETINYCWRCGNTFDHTDDDPDVVCRF